MRHYVQSTAERGAKLWLLALTILLAILPSCQAQPDDLDLLRRILTLSGLEFAGELPQGVKVSNEWTTDKIVPIPRLHISKTYIFVRRGAFSHEYFAEQVFPALLQDKGFTVVERPSRSSGYQHIFIGGPTYNIKFSMRDQTYQLRIKYMPSLSRGGEILDEVFILDMPRRSID